MMRTNLNRALAFAAVMLLATGAAAQSPNAAPQAKGNADKKEEKKGDKPEDKAKGGADKTDDKDKDKAKGGDRETRKNAEHAAQKAKLATMLKSPPDDALRQELRRHAERTARLERIKSLATESKDKDIIEKATKLLEKENARHEKWMGKVSSGSTGTPTTATAATAAPATPTPAPTTTTTTDNKGGAK
jgi:hypothetical protein